MRRSPAELGVGGPRHNPRDYIFRPERKKKTKKLVGKHEGNEYTLVRKKTHQKGPSPIPVGGALQNWGGGKFETRNK